MSAAADKRLSPCCVDYPIVTVFAKLKDHIENHRRQFIGTAAKKVYLSILDQSVVSGTNFVILILLARNMLSFEYGSFALAWTTLVILVAVQNALITSPLTILGAQKIGVYQDEYIGNLLLIQTITGASISIFMVVGSFLITADHTDLSFLATTFVSMAVSSFFFLGQDFFRRVFLTRLELGKALMSDVIASIVKLSGIIFLSMKGKLSPSDSFLIIALGSGLGCISGYLHLRSSLKVNVSHLRGTLRENWQVGKWLVAELIPYTLSGQVYIYLVALFLSLAATGAFAASQAILNVTNVYVVAVLNLLTPVASRKCMEKGKKEMFYFMERNKWVVFAPVIFYCIIVAAFPEFILRLFYQEKYLGFGWLIIILSIQTLFSFLYRQKQVVLMALRRTDIGFYSKSISALVTFVLVYPMLKYLNVYGAAVNTTITTLIWFIANSFFVRRIMREPGNEALRH